VDASEVVPGLTLIAVLAIMLVELRISQANERILRQRGAVDVDDRVYGAMRWAYPAAFVVMAIEGTLRGALVIPVMWAGLVVFLAAKALKTWAIASLGHRWTYRVLVLPDAPLVTRGPYAFIRHPNYVGVIGELVGFAMLTGALVSGPLATIVFAELVRRRIVAEEKALGIR
jgi:methyltransferase